MLPLAWGRPATVKRRLLGQKATEAAASKAEGTEVVQFNVTADGNVADIKILGYLLPATKYYLCVHGVSKRSNGI